MLLWPITGKFCPHKMVRISASASTFNEITDWSTTCWLLWLTRPASFILARHGKGLVELIKRIGELSGSQQFFTGKRVANLLVTRCFHIRVIFKQGEDHNHWVARTSQSRSALNGWLKFISSPLLYRPFAPTQAQPLLYFLNAAIPHNTG